MHYAAKMSFGDNPKQSADAIKIAPNLRTKRPGVASIKGQFEKRGISCHHQVNRNTHLGDIG